MNALNRILDAPWIVATLVKITIILAAAWIGHAVLAWANPRWRVLLWRVTAVSMIVLAAVAWWSSTPNCPPIPPAPGPMATFECSTCAIPVIIAPNSTPGDAPNDATSDAIAFSEALPDIPLVKPAEESLPVAVHIEWKLPVAVRVEFKLPPAREAEPVGSPPAASSRS